jgi:hypothetical protein
VCGSSEAIKTKLALKKKGEEEVEKQLVLFCNPIALWANHVIAFFNLKKKRQTIFSARKVCQYSLSRSRSLPVVKCAKGSEQQPKKRNTRPHSRSA